MTEDIFAASRVVEEVLRISASARSTPASRADVIACLLAAALSADGQVSSEELHVALSVAEALARVVHDIEP
jgi:hypothetical protein